MLGGNPAQGSTPATNLLYTGEQWDTDSQHYYNRARWYNPMNGLFNRMDPYAGNTQDPQSLHKYLYCHNNPVNGIDPSGMFSIIRVALTVAIVATFLTIGLVAYTAHKTKRTFFGVVKDVDGALFKGCFLDVKIDGAYKQMRPKTILVKYKSCIEDSARKEGIPPDLLAGVLNTEMRNYGILDIFGDDFAYGSIGPAQMKVVNVKKWIPELKSKSDKEVEDLLLDPLV